jgi:hypothetical protein
MIEVFKTAVTSPLLADLLSDQIHRVFPGYKANFDLEDCDRILRVEHPRGEVQAAAIIHLLESRGIAASVLPDEIVHSPRSTVHSLHQIMN